MMLVARHTLVIVGLCCSWPTLSPAETPRVIRGEVVAVDSRWAHGDIVSDVTIRGSDGATVVVTQIGGRVGDIAMVASHRPRVLHVGDQLQATLVQRFAARPGQRASAGLRDIVLLEPERRAGGAGTLPTARYGVNRTGQSQRPLYWPTGCIHLAYDAAGTSHLPDDRELEIMADAIREWEEETSVCTGLSFSTKVVGGLTGGRDFVNSVVWLDDDRCRPGADPDSCLDSGTIGATKLYFVDNPESPFDAQIVEADIEFNGVDFAFTDGGMTLADRPRRADLASTATHELGHLLGLTHNCSTNDADDYADHQGNLVPSCSDVPPSSEITEATMYYMQVDDEVKKATLESSDVLGGCATLGAATCDRIVRGGCVIAPGQARGRGDHRVWVLGILLLGLARRSRSMSRSR